MAEQRVREVRVVPRLIACEHLLRIDEPREQLLFAGEDERFPDFAGRLALKAGRVREHPT